jgi:hypothetical protein
LPIFSIIILFTALRTPVLCVYVNAEVILHGKRNVGNPITRWLEQDFDASQTGTDL